MSVDLRDVAPFHPKARAYVRERPHPRLPQGI